MSACTSSTDKPLMEIKQNPPVKGISKLNIEPFQLESIESSYIGEITLVRDSIYFIDKRFCWVFSFDTNGHFQNRYLGQGAGPSEIETGIIEGCAIMPNQSVFMGGGRDCYVYDSKFNRQSKFIAGFDKQDTREGYEAPYIYTLCYNNLQLKTFGNHIYINMVVEHPDFNFFTKPDEHFDKGHYLMKINIDTQEAEAMLGKYPPLYIKNDNFRQFSFINFDIDTKGNFYISFEADSLIYKYDKNFMPQYAYGYEGRAMEKCAQSFSSPQEFRKHYMENRNTYGYYSSLKYIEEQNMLFRGYIKSKKAETDGLQIYHNDILIGDIDTPKGFKVIGYCSPYYYGTSPIDEDNETITIYRFKLPE